MIRESQIKHSAGRYWVLDTRRDYSVMCDGLTHAESDSSYARTPDGLSIAIARADYLAKRDSKASAP